MPKMVCVECEVEFKPRKNGVHVIEHASFGPYKLWSADKWYCPGCRTEVVAGFAKYPAMKHYEEGFEEKLQELEDVVNDYESISQREAVRNAN